MDFGREFCRVGARFVVISYSICFLSSLEAPLMIEVEDDLGNGGQVRVILKFLGSHLGILQEIGLEKERRLRRGGRARSAFTSRFISMEEMERLERLDNIFQKIEYLEERFSLSAQLLEVRSVSSLLYQKSRRRLEALEPHRLDFLPVLGVDDRVCGCRYIHPERGIFYFVASCICQDNPHFRFAYEVFHLAWLVMENPESVRLLENLYDQLNLGLPVKITGEGPRVLRIFGYLREGMEKSLFRFLERFDPYEPLLIDLTNFKGMSSRLYPMWIQFLCRPGPVVWWVGRNYGHTVAHLRNLRVNPERISSRKQGLLDFLRSYSDGNFQGEGGGGGFWWRFARIFRSFRGRREVGDGNLVGREEEILRLFEEE